MCGIIGIIAEQQTNVVVDALRSLKKLEYRGYDSAGIAAYNEQKGLQYLKAVGKVDDLIAKERQYSLSGNIVIAHTRWATHGEPTDYNAHPHVSHNQIAVVHNGIVENYAELKRQLLGDSYQFNSDTDTEVVAHAIHSCYRHNNDFLSAVHQTIQRLHGSFALVIFNSLDPNKLIAVRHGSPLVIGLGKGTNYFSSDAMSLLEFTNEFIYLEEGDICIVDKDTVTIFDEKLKRVERESKQSRLMADAAEKGEYVHYMLKEIYEQPQAIKNTLQSSMLELATYVSKINNKINQLRIIACGSSYHAALVARYWCESLLGISCDVDIGSEFRYRDVPVALGTLFVTISQSGETADTLAALRLAKKQSYLGYLTICNVPESSLARESDFAFMTHAGVEIGVATTKAFTAQLVNLFLLVLLIGKEKKLLGDEYTEYMQDLRQLPVFAEQVLNFADSIRALAERLYTKNSIFYLGRAFMYPIALEGALKLKEISYMHAEAYPGGELKHGPLALIDSSTPVIVVAPHDKLWDKISANMHEVAARGGELIVFTDIDSEDEELWLRSNGIRVTVIKMPKVVAMLAPIIYVIALQLLSYHMAVFRGTNVDQPRNLAKSVTVE